MDDDSRLGAGGGMSERHVCEQIDQCTSEAPWVVVG
jgi:hypothetical protein